MYVARDCGDFSRRDVGRLKRVLAWFGRNLRAPKQVHPRAIFWFRSDAHACIDKIWDLVRLLRENDVEVTMMRTREPGQIEYHDPLQVPPSRLPTAGPHPRRRENLELAFHPVEPARGLYVLLP
jgi:hypothetical protein